MSVLRRGLAIVDDQGGNFYRQNRVNNIKAEREAIVWVSVILPRLQPPGKSLGRTAALGVQLLQ
jgi:hypothetical protein